MAAIRDNQKSLKSRFLARNGYILAGTIGLGNYAKVKQAYDRKCRRNVAIKIVDKNRTPQDYLTKFFPREIDHLKKLKHKNVAELLDVIEDDSSLYIVLELADAGDLLEYIRVRKMLSEPTARHFFKQMCAGMKYCHNRGIVHRDLKCENVLICSDQTAKICDFGFATKVDNRMFLTTFCGSTAYASPEILQGQPYNGFKADVWSMGIVLYAMVFGTLPFADQRVKIQIAQMQSRDYPKFQSVRPRKEVSRSLIQLLRKILVVSFHERPVVTAIEKATWLQAISKTQSFHPDSTLPNSVTASVNRSRPITQDGDNVCHIQCLPISVPTEYQQRHIKITPTINCNHLPSLVPPGQHTPDLRTDFCHALRMIGRVRRQVPLHNVNCHGVAGRTPHRLSIQSRQPTTSCRKFALNNSWKPEVSSNTEMQNKQ